MASFIAVKKLKALYPVDEAGEAILRTLAQGELVTLELKRPRNLQFHQKFFAMLSIILANQDYYKSIDDLLDVCKLAVGHCRTIRTKQGDVKIPMSISFAALDDSSFADFYDRVIVWVCTEVIPGLKRGDLDEAVEAELLRFGD